MYVAVPSPEGHASPLQRRRDHRRRHGESANEAEAAAAATRAVRRPTPGYHNDFQAHPRPSTEAPPSYATSQLTVPRKPAAPRPSEGHDRLPAYTCSISQEGVLNMVTELTHPFRAASAPMWREVYVVLRGTQLSIYKVASSFGSKDEALRGPGKLIKAYTLQHAEVGIAADTRHSSFIPLRSVARLIAPQRRRRYYEKDPTLFRYQRYHVMRLRLETDQVLLSCASETTLLSWVENLCAAIDIAPPLDDRTSPNQHTVPRRRRAAGDRSNGRENLDASRRLIEQQERILREMYPSFASETTPETPSLELSAEGIRARHQPTPDAPEDPDADELDNNAAFSSSPASTNAHSEVGDPVLSMLEPLERSRRPSASRETTLSTVAIRGSLTVSDFDSETGKWSPPQMQTTLQHLRYRRRCMPSLLADSPRASDVLIEKGKRVQIDWEAYALVPFVLEPPSYRSHGFPAWTQKVEVQVQQQPLERSVSSLSVQSSSSAEGISAPAPS
ncbi:hypothetical protein BJ546DRAFT_430386 [Cryomyces antarcticus]